MSVKKHKVFKCFGIIIVLSIVIVSTVLILLSKSEPKFSPNDVKVSFTGKYSLEEDYDVFGWPPQNMNLYRVEWRVENNSNYDLYLLKPKFNQNYTTITPSGNGWSSEHYIPKNFSDKFVVSYLIAKTIKDEDIIEELKKVESEYTYVLNPAKPEDTITGTVEW